MAKKKTGRVVYAVGVRDRGDAPGTVKERVLKPVAMPGRLDLTDTSAVNAAEPSDRASNYEPEDDMVFVPQGTFIMGDDEGSRDEQPQRRVHLDSFWIDKMPVMNIDYRLFVEATGHRKPPHWTSFFPEDKWSQPVTNVSYDDAQAYARWAGKRLPTEAEWEKAARGTLGQTYPWGDAFRRDHVNSSNEHGGLTPVDKFPGGASPYGVLDMVGNAMEWCEDWYYDDYYRRGPDKNPEGPEGGQYRIVRGGFYGGNKADVRCTSRHWAPPENMQDHIGFRCAKTPLRPGESARQIPTDVRQAAMAEAPPIEEENRMVPIAEDQPLAEIAKHHPESVSKVIRAMLHEDQSAGVVQTAILMIGVGVNTAAGIMKYLLDSEIDLIAREMTERQVVTAEERDGVFGAFKARLLAGTHLDYGGPDFTTEVLKRALGPRKAQALFERWAPEVSTELPLSNLAPNVIAPLLTKEHPQTAALILSRMDADKAMAVVALMEVELAADVVYRMGKLEPVRVHTLRSMEEALANDLRNMMTGQVKVGGPEAVAALLGHAGEEREVIMERIRKQDASFADEVEGKPVGTAEDAEDGEGR